MVYEENGVHLRLRDHWLDRDGGASRRERPLHFQHVAGHYEATETAHGGMGLPTNDLPARLLSRPSRHSGRLATVSHTVCRRGRRRGCRGADRANDVCVVSCSEVIDSAISTHPRRRV